MPPLTGAERAKRHIEKLKAEGKYEEFKLKRTLVNKKCRDSLKNKISALSPPKSLKKRKEIRAKTKQRVQKHRKNYEALQKAKEREKVRKRVEKHRQNKKCSELNQSNIYPTESSRRKALSRAQKGLPKSLDKRKQIVKDLHEKYFDVPKLSLPTKRSSGLDDNVKNAVISFYERPDISQQAPGRKDYVTIKDESGEKIKVQKKYLMFPINEVYDKFCKEVGSVPLKRSTFFGLRPKHVISSSKTPHNICLCVYHSNFYYAINAFKKVVPEMPQHGDQDFYETYFCEPITEACYFGNCKNCERVFADTILGVASNNKDAKVKWQAWKKADNRWQNKQQIGTVEELANYIVDLAPHFYKHHYINEEQLKSYQRCVSGVENDKSAAVVQIDFAENYKCVFQDEAGNAHWNQSQVSLFTAAIWTRGDMKSYSVVTDDLDHSKRTIVPYIDRLFDELPKDIKTVHIWSDGPSSQFKNKFIATVIPVLERKHKMKIAWSFFAASHGKGPTDGTGGALKNQVWTAVKTREVIVCNARDFSEAISRKSKVKVMVMDSVDIDERNTSMNLNSIFDNAKTIRGIFDFHHLQVVNGDIKGFETTKEVCDC